MTVKYIQVKVGVMDDNGVADDFWQVNQPAIIDNGIGLHRPCNGDDFWVITHLNTGLKFLEFKDFKTAYKVFKWFQNNGIRLFDFYFPEMTAELYIWFADTIKFALQENELDPNNGYICKAR